MTVREKGFLLLTSRLGNPARPVLTPAQLRTLTLKVQSMEPPDQDRELTLADLAAIGCGKDLAQKVLHLLSQEELLRFYLEDGYRMGCQPLTRLGDDYPQSLRNALGPEAPGALWTKGDLALLRRPMISLVGSRDLMAENREFAEAVGREAAMQGFTLVSGNARGADRTAQDACLAQGGTVISVVADRLKDHPAHPRILYISEEGFDLTFTAQRALQRNRIIHSLGQKVFVAQCRLGTGGTWSGTHWNLSRGIRPVFCLADSSPATQELVNLGAQAISMEALRRIDSLSHQYLKLF